MNTQTQNKTQMEIQNVVWIKSHGEKLNSKYPERRKWFVYSNITDLSDLLRFVEAKSRELMVSAIPWWIPEDPENIETLPCKYCRINAERARRLKLPDTWNNYFCLRHGVLEHVLEGLPLLDNKTRILVFNNNAAYYTTQSNKYIITISLYGSYALANIYNRFKKRIVTFTYRNYDSGDNNHSSSYKFIVKMFGIKLKVLEYYITCRHIKEEDDYFSVFFNGELICSPSE